MNKLDNRKYCNYCGDYVGDGCDNTQCEDFKIRNITIKKFTQVPSLSDFINHVYENSNLCSFLLKKDPYSWILLYNNLLKKTLSVEIFVPFLNGKALKTPLEKDYPPNAQYHSDVITYQKAQKEVLFDGFEVRGDFIYNNDEYHCDLKIDTQDSCFPVKTISDMIDNECANYKINQNFWDQLIK